MQTGRRYSQPDARRNPETLNMERNLVGKRPTFHRDKPRPYSYRILLWVFLIIVAVWFLLQTQRGAVKPLFQPTPTPTRIANSYILQAEAYFAAGKLDDPNTTSDAIDTYKKALEVDPENAQAWAQLARIQTYSSNLLSTKNQQKNRMAEARLSIEKAVALAPDNSTVHAIYALVLDWSALYELASDKAKMLNQALDEAVRALQLDPNDALALAFYAEVQLDSQKWNEAQQYAEQAVARAPDLMDTHRVYATVLESLQAYRLAIEEYEKAAAITPNLTFLYINIGVNYRHLQVYDKALDYFDRAVTINEQLQVKDPLPYIAIAKTYSQMGEFFSAALNAEKALLFDPSEANTYGQLGIIYFKSRNYESSLPTLQCAVVSCSAEQNLTLKRLVEANPTSGAEVVAVQGLPLDTREVAYYYAIYGQALAYLSRPQDNRCPQAYEVLEKVRSVYPDETVLMEIVDGSEAICRKLEGTP